MRHFLLYYLVQISLLRGRREERERDRLTSLPSEMSNFGTKVITGRLPYSVPITYFIELFTKFSSAGSCYYIQTLRSWRGDKLQNITHTVTELLHLYSSCLPRPTGVNILQSLSQSFHSVHIHLVTSPLT